MAKVSFYTYTVSSKFDFPIDMLRYDCAYPISADDAASLAESIRGEHKKIISINLGSHREPTSERWSSFLWTVTDIVKFKKDMT